MDKITPKKYGRRAPEAKIQAALIDFLRLRGWHVMPTHGGIFQQGFPDLFCCHLLYGQRWVEVKRPNMKGSKFTVAQLEQFPKICANGSGVWVLTGPIEKEYLKLFEPSNWWKYTKAFQ